MFIQQKVLKYLKNKKGSATIVALAGVIAAAMATFLFEAIEQLSEAQRFRIAHLHNAVQIATAADIMLSGRLFQDAGEHNFEGTITGKSSTLVDIKTKLSNTITGVQINQEGTITLQDLESLGYLKTGKKRSICS